MTDAPAGPVAPPLPHSKPPRMSRCWPGSVSAGLSSLQGLQNIFLRVGWDWRSFESVIGVRTPGKSFCHRPGLSFTEEGHLCQWKHRTLLSGDLFCQVLQATQLCAQSPPHGAGTSWQTQQEQCGWFTGRTRNGSRGPSSLEDGGKRKGEKILLKLWRREIGSCQDQD